MGFVFAAPLALLGLLALPAIWWLLRVTPPAPREIVFPATRLLRGLKPEQQTPLKTPWPLLAAAALHRGAGVARDGGAGLEPERHRARQRPAGCWRSTTAGRRRLAGSAAPPPPPR